MGSPGGTGNTSYDGIATPRRKVGNLVPAQREPSIGIGPHLVQCDLRSECQGSEEGIANGLGEVPSLPKVKTFLL